MKYFPILKDSRFLVAVCIGLALCMVGQIAKRKGIVQTGGENGNKTIVVDCGHGGIDPGKVGINGVYEKDINLSIGTYLKEALEKKKFHVIMTREKDTGLYQEQDSNKKIADLRERVAIMNQEQVDLIVSIHQNSFTSESSRGAQVFYQIGSQKGKECAKILQDQLKESLNPDNHRVEKANSSYYLLKKTEKPAVIIECGFLSNSQEAQELCQKKYQKKVAEAIERGLTKYFS